MLLLYLKAALLGIVEGLTEFLPISSTGHLILVGDLIHFNDEKGKVFEIAIQMGAILAVLWEYRERWTKTIGGIFTQKTARQFGFNLVVATLPAVVVGLFFHRSIKTYLFNPLTVAIALMVGGILILWIESKKFQAKIRSIDQMGWKDALKIGCFQLISMIPGVSRAGATIMGGMLSGLSRPTSTLFSFFLAIPTLSGATLLDLYKNRHLLQASDGLFFAIGFLTAFFSALMIIRWFLQYVSHHHFKPFGWYRIILGILVLIGWLGFRY